MPAPPSRRSCGSRWSARCVAAWAERHTAGSGLTGLVERRLLARCRHQKRQVQVLWRPVIEALVAAGVDLPRRDVETDKLRWD